jgi:hypothetical protein
MGERAKKQRAAEAKAAKKAKTANLKAAQLAETPSSLSASTDTTLPDVNVATRSNASKKKAAAPTRQSARSHGSSASSSTLGSGTSSKNHASANLEGNDNRKSRPQRSASAAALDLLQELQVSDTEEAEHDPEGVLVFTGNDDEDEDGGTDGDSNESSDSDIVMIEELPAVARKTLPKVQKKSNLQAIDEEDSDSSSDGE